MGFSPHLQLVQRVGVVIEGVVHAHAMRSREVSVIEEQLVKLTYLNLLCPPPESNNL